MARFPCEFSNHAFQGRAYYFYPAVLGAEDEDRRRIRVCAEHSELLLGWLEARTECQQKPRLFEESGPPLCGWCQEPMEGAGAQLFVTAYVAADEDVMRLDFWAPVHSYEAASVWSAFQTPQIEPEHRPRSKNGR
jgi:hypothetical protein